jgi:hypothetical protein
MTRFFRTLTLAPALALVTVLLLVPLPVGDLARRWPALFGELENAAHPLVFAWLAWLGFRLLRRRFPAPHPLPYLLTFAAAIGFGLATEAVQAMVGRDSAWVDLWNDALGAVCALALIARHERRTRSPGHASQSASATIALAAMGLAFAPLAWTLTAYTYRAAMAPVLWQDTALMKRFSVWQTGQYEGLEIRELAGDWRGYRQLAVDVRNIGDEPVDITLRVHDLAHDHMFPDRYNGRFTLAPGAASTLSIPVETIRTAPATRVMDLAEMRVIVVFQDATQKSRFRVTEVRLVR